MAKGGGSIPGQALNVSQAAWFCQKQHKKTNKNFQNSANVGATKAAETAPVYKINTGRQFYLEIIMTKVSSSLPFLTKQKPCSSEILKSGF